MQRREGPNATLGIVPEQKAAVARADDVNFGSSRGSIDEVAERHAESLGDAEGDAERGTRSAPLDLAEHAAADAGETGELLERPAFFLPHRLDAVANQLLERLGLA